MTFQLENRAKSRRSWTLIGSCIAAVMMLGACQDPEVIFPGKREDIRSVLQSSGQASDVSVLASNESRLISLPGPTANTEWTQAVGSENHRIANASLGGALKLAWTSKIGAGDSRKQRITADPVIAGGLIYTLDANTTVTATNASGAQVWARDVGARLDGAGGGTGGGLAAHKGTLYVSTGFGELIALDSKNGNERWVQKLNGTASGQPTVSGNLVYVVSADDIGWAIEADTGRVAWRINATTSVSNVLGSPAPVVAGDFTVFAFGSGELQAVFRRGGLRRWDASVLGARRGQALSKVDDVTGSPVVSNGVLYAGNQAGSTIAVDVQSGSLIWATTEGAVGPVWPAGDSVFSVTDRNELVRLDASDGSKVWGYKLPYFVKDRPRRVSKIFTHHGPILAGGRLIVASSDGKLRHFDPTDGSLIGSVEVPGGATTAPVVAGGTLYVVSGKGQLHAFR